MHTPSIPYGDIQNYFCLIAEYDGLVSNSAKFSQSKH